MTAEDNRLSNLREIVDAHAKALGGKLRAGYRAVSTATGLDEEYVYQLYKGIKKVVGPDAARTIARVYANGRDMAWFDLPPAPVPPVTTTGDEAMRAMPTIGATILHLGALAGALNEMGRASIAPLIARVLENPELASEAAAMADAIVATQQMDLKNDSVSRAFERARSSAPVETDMAPLEPKRK